MNVSFVLHCICSLITGLRVLYSSISWSLLRHYSCIYILINFAFVSLSMTERTVFTLSVLMDLSISTFNSVDFKRCYILKLYLLDFNIIPSIILLLKACSMYFSLLLSFTLAEHVHSCGQCAGEWSPSPAPFTGTSLSSHTLCWKLAVF